MYTVLDYMSLYGGGPGSGCQGPNCGRKPGVILLEQGKTPIDTRFMKLSLTTGGTMPILFENDDDLNWNWSADKKTLHIEQVQTKKTDYPTGFTEKEVYDVPAENIREWVPDNGPEWSQWKH